MDVAAVAVIAARAATVADHFETCEIGKAAGDEPAAFCFILARACHPGPHCETRDPGLCVCIDPGDRNSVLRRLYVGSRVCACYARLRGSIHSFWRLNRNALVMTETDDRLMASAASIGDSRIPKTG